MLKANGSNATTNTLVTDSATFTEPVGLERAWIWLPEAEIEPYECAG